MDDVVIRIRGEQHSLWRVVDQDDYRAVREAAFRAWRDAAGDA
jgi:transposase-like protein